MLMYADVHYRNYRSEDEQCRHALQAHGGRHEHWLVPHTSNAEKLTLTL